MKKNRHTTKQIIEKLPQVGCANSDEDDPRRSGDRGREILNFFGDVTSNREVRWPPPKPPGCSRLFRQDVGNDIVTLTDGIAKRGPAIPARGNAFPRGGG